MPKYYNPTNESVGVLGDGLRGLGSGSFTATGIEKRSAFDQNFFKKYQTDLFATQATIQTPLIRPQVLKLPGSLATAVIDSKLMWNNTGIWLEAGKTYNVHAPHTWIDAYINTTADGYESFDSQVRWYARPILYASESLRRQPQQNWFKLIGCINKTGCMPFGSQYTFTAPSSGYLTCYANDYTSIFANGYSNNKGSITITVTRVS